jgi:serine/threonine protein kinase
MLQHIKYSGPEADIWSLGIIFYTLVTGSLPFDDDDEGVMKRMIIKGEYLDPVWLSQGEPTYLWYTDTDHGMGRCERSDTLDAPT